MRRFAVASVVLVLASVVGATGSSLARSPARPAVPNTVWLCLPGQTPDPCTAGLSTTVYTATFKRERVRHPQQVTHPPIDCFYVYPTVSDQRRGNATLRIDPEERSIALYQAARFSQYCRVFAPMRREVTFASLVPGAATGRPNRALPFADVVKAFITYLVRYNHHRGFVLIGDGAGALVLRSMIAAYIDPRPELRKYLVSAILLDANVLVKRGKQVGGDFQHIPACRSATQLGCVIAYSSFDGPVPSQSLFGRPTRAEIRRRHEAVLCTNPTALSGSGGRVIPIFPSQPFDPGSVFSMLLAGSGLPQPQPATVWTTQPHAYRAHCSLANNADVLQVTPVNGAALPKPSPGPAWGLSVVDMNLTLGNLISIVGREAQAFVREQG